MQDQKSEATTSPAVSRLPVILIVIMLLVFSGFFIFFFADLSTKGGGQIPEDQLSSDSYMDLVEPLLVNADPARAPEILAQPGITCLACHLHNLGPSFDALPEVAAERRPPLQPAAYLYESILHPGAFVVEGPWNNNMPRNFGDLLSDQQLGDLIAWLLLPTEERPDAS